MQMQNQHRRERDMIFVYAAALAELTTRIRSRWRRQMLRCYAEIAVIVFIRHGRNPAYKVNTNTNHNVHKQTGDARLLHRRRLRRLHR